MVDVSNLGGKKNYNNFMSMLFVATRPALVQRPSVPWPKPVVAAAGVVSTEHMSLGHCEIKGMWILTDKKKELGKCGGGTTCHCGCNCS